MRFPCPSGKRMAASSRRARRESAAPPAAANWHALATFAGRLVPDRPALLIDIGTTTADLIPLNEGVPVPVGRTDRERLQSGELVYSGVKRTPVCALVSEIPFRGQLCPVAAEFFATTLDVYLALGLIPEDSRHRDGQRPPGDAGDGPRSARAVALLRRDRILGGRHGGNGSFDRPGTAAADRPRHRARAGRAALVPQRLVISGVGSFLAEQTVDEMPVLAGAERIRLRDLGPAVAEAACAFADGAIGCRTGSST